MKFNTLYGKDSKGSLKIWEIHTEGGSFIIKHGKLGGKIQEKSTLCEAKNVGRANETTLDEQAILEAGARFIKQKKKGYFENKEDALGYVERSPMKCQNWNDYKHKIIYPCYVQPKLNGLRLFSDGQTAQSKAGEEYKIPKHWEKDIEQLNLTFPLDGEVYAGYEKQGGLSLQKINSAFKKYNDNTSLLKWYIYDVSIDAEFSDRNQKLALLRVLVEDSDIENIVIVEAYLVMDEEEGDDLYADWVERGAEGMIYRNRHGLYEHGKRSYNIQKRKPRQTIEAKVISVECDHNNQGILSCRLQNGVEVKCQMRVDADEINYRQIDNAINLINKFIEIEFEEYSDAGVPTKPVGLRLRKVDELTWEAKE
jgi:DNA ligase-1